MSERKKIKKKNLKTSRDLSVKLEEGLNKRLKWLWNFNEKSPYYPCVMKLDFGP
jgi:hypothetical protein